MDIKTSKPKEEKQCCVCGATTDLYSQTPEKGPWVIKTYCGKCLPK